MRSYNCPFCNGKHNIGEECPNKYKYKKEHASEENKKVNKFYSSKAWKEKREEIKARDCGLCQRCLIKFSIVTIENLEIHHILSLIKYYEKRLCNENLITLCKNCHRTLDIKNDGKLDFEWSPPKEEFDFEFR